MAGPKAGSDVRPGNEGGAFRGGTRAAVCCVRASGDLTRGPAETVQTNGARSGTPLETGLRGRVRLRNCSAPPQGGDFEATGSLVRWFRRSLGRPSHAGLAGPDMLRSVVRGRVGIGPSEGRSNSTGRPIGLFRAPKANVETRTVWQLGLAVRCVAGGVAGLRHWPRSGAGALNRC